MKFENGDRVKVLDIKVDDEKRGVLFTKDMKKLVGRVFTIANEDTTDDVYIMKEPEANYYFAKEWIELVPDSEEKVEITKEGDKVVAEYDGRKESVDYDKDDVFTGSALSAMDKLDDAVREEAENEDDDTEFNVGDIVIGNFEAESKYLITTTGFVGLVTYVDEDGEHIHITGYGPIADKLGKPGIFKVRKDCFDVMITSKNFDTMSSLKGKKAPTKEETKKEMTKMLDKMFESVKKIFD